MGNGSLRQFFHRLTVFDAAFELLALASSTSQQRPDMGLRWFVMTQLALISAERLCPADVIIFQPYRPAPAHNCRIQQASNIPAIRAGGTRQAGAVVFHSPVNAPIMRAKR